MKAARLIMLVLSAMMNTLTLFGLYRIACEVGGFASPKQMGLQGIYLVIQLVVCVALFFGIRRLSVKAFRPEKFLLFWTIISFVILIVVVSIGLRVSKRLQPRARISMVSVHS